MVILPNPIGIPPNLGRRKPPWAADPRNPGFKVFSSEYLQAAASPYGLQALLQALIFF